MSKFTLDKAEWQYESSKKEYIEKSGISEDKITDEDIEVIWNCAANHISMFLTWLIDNDLLSEDHEENEEEIQKVKNREMTGFEYFEINCDLKLIRDDISDSIYQFMDDYYESKSGYLGEYCDYMEKLNKEVLATCFDWNDYEEIRKNVIDVAYNNYLNK